MSNSSEQHTFTPYIGFKIRKYRRWAPLAFAITPFLVAIVAILAVNSMELGLLITTTSLIVVILMMMKDMVERIGALGRNLETAMKNQELMYKSLQEKKENQEQETVPLN